MDEGAAALDEGVTESAEITCELPARCQPICGWPSEVEVARLQSDKRGKILDFYLLLRHCLADTLQVVKMLD